jgi:hypothetical protein
MVSQLDSLVVILNISFPMNMMNHSPTTVILRDEKPERTDKVLDNLNRSVSRDLVC